MKRIIPSLVGAGAGEGDWASSIAAAAGRETVKRRAKNRTVTATDANFIAITSIFL